MTWTDAFRGLQVRVLRSQGGVWEAFVRVETVRGPIHQHVRVDEADIRDRLASQLVPDGAAVGNIFKQFGRWISRTAKKVARWGIWKKIGKVIKDIVNSPIVAGIVGVASTFFPPIGAAYVAAKSAVNVVDQISKGNGSAMKAVGQIAQAAVAKNPLAQDAIAAVRAAEQSPLAKFIGPVSSIASNLIPAVTGT